ncbi:hypothetical protein [Methanobrevibacter sp.]|uniref:hypothetical protein n=1 Tax=Methanobrevibacter sp. TaxID=66852 RepID=UPI002E7752E4|nr:hypothetical protein [Methanobrevibacter sp.]MEE0940058.1 hypothetical protein [Methanobrevibacter sp.]
MNKRKIEYLIIATVIILLIYGGYCLMSHKYLEQKADITDSISVNYPAGSQYTVVGDTIEFKNPQDSFYNMNISKLNSTDNRITTLLNNYAAVNEGTIDYKNETCYLITLKFEENQGFKYHSLIIPYNSFNKDNLTFTKDTSVYLFEANNREFVVDTAFNSKVKT